jgi:hypothetical protein
MSLSSIFGDDDRDAQPIEGVVWPNRDDALEPFCRACQADVGRFETRGGAWTHFTGDPLTDNIEPYDADHRPLVGLRPALGAPVGR